MALYIVSYGPSSKKLIHRETFKLLKDAQRFITDAMPPAAYGNKQAYSLVKRELDGYGISISKLAERII